MKWFQPEEFACPCGVATCSAPKGPHRLLGFYVDRMREAYGQPIVITSGNRCPEHNRLEGGVDKSEHVWPEGCLGCDVRVQGAHDRARLLDAARLAGLMRVGVYVAHLHVGCGEMVDATVWPAPVVWWGARA